MDVADLLAVMIGRADVVVAIADVAGDLGMSLEDAAALVTLAEGDGLVDVWWERPEGPAVVLTSRTAERLGLRVDDRSNTWVPAAAPERGPRKAMRGREVVEADLNGEPEDPGPLDSFPDTEAVEPHEAAAVAEAAERSLPRKRSKADYVPYVVPRPRVLLGSSSIWPVRPRRDGTCGVCGGRRLPPVWYCLLCDNFGCQHLLPPVERMARRRRHEPAGLKGGRG